MSYSGTGQRLSMTEYAAGQSATTNYTLDSQQYNAPLVASSDGNDTIFLYGLRPIAEKMETWGYMLADASNTPRQLTDSQGKITLSGRYTPWGSLMEYDGTGNFVFGYFGGLMDSATGLMYVGNGQYCDPATGRFLTRKANPYGPNPYVPWNPINGILAPIGLASIFFSRKKKNSKFNNRAALIALIFLVISNLACCHPESPAQPTQEPETSPTGTAPAGPATVPVTTTPTTPPIQQPETDDTCVGCESAGRYYMSAYYIVGEDQYSDEGGIVSVPASGNAKTKAGLPSNSYWYLSKGGLRSGYYGLARGGSGDELTARYKFLCHGLGYALGYTNETGGICVQGTGKLLDEHGGYYIYCPQSLDFYTPDTKMEEAGVGFEWQDTEFLQNSILGHEFDTIAICLEDPNLSKGQEIVIPDLKDFMAGRTDSDSNGKTTFTVRDSGSALCTTKNSEPYNEYNTLDLFVGTGKNALENHANPLIQRFPKPTSVEVFFKP